jgi:hypothetical protein
MKTLKEALDLASAYGDETSSWEDFIASLESNGYCIVPMEATEEMAKASCELDCTRQECARSGRCRAYPEQLNAKREHWNDMLAARPKIED